MIIRRLTKSEIPVAAEMSANCLREEGWPVDESKLINIQQEMEAILTDHSSLILIAEDIGRAVGCIQLAYGDNPAIGSFIDVSNWYVIPEYRNKKVGWKLLQAAAASIRKDDIPIFMNTTQPLSRGYQRLGFQTISYVNVASLKDIREALGG